MMGTNATLEEKMLSYSVLREGESEDIRRDETEELELEKGEYDVENVAPDERRRVEGETRAMLQSEEARLRASADPLAERRHGPQHGPKGVQADAKWAEFQEQKMRDREAMERADMLRAGGVGSLLTSMGGGGGGSISLSSVMRREQERRRGRERANEGDDDDDEDDEEEKEEGGGRGRGRGRGAPRAISITVSGTSVEGYTPSELIESALFSGGGGGLAAAAHLKVSSSSSSAILSATGSSKADDNDDDDDDDEEDDFVKRYREERMKSLKLAASLPHFDAVQELTDAAMFVSSVDGVDARAYCVVLLYELFIPSCRNFLALWPLVATSLPRTAFMAMKSSIASENFDVKGLPACIIYRGGEVVASCVGMSPQEGGMKLTLDDVLRLLAENGISN